MSKFKPSPIETHYNDLRFRSRLEARWAIFLDALSIPYQYEPEGYHLGSLGNYLPDFFLPTLNLWLEIKGRHPTPLEINRMRALVIYTQSPGYILWGDISAAQFQDAHYAYIPSSRNAIFVPEQRWTECPRCNAITISNRGEFSDCFCDASPSPTSPRLLAAYRAARTARFEFGENGSKPRPKSRWRRK